MMPPWDAFRQPHNAPIRSLTALFIAWKSLLLIIALLSPGPGYDTSTQLLIRGYGVHEVDSPLWDGHSATSIGERLVQKLLRWDAIYFATIAERGYQLEQEWAFGWGFTRLLAFLANYVPITNSNLLNVAYHGIFVANASHILSVFVLHRLALALPLVAKESRAKFGFIAATLHIISPAGLFLSAPNAESLFSLLNFLGQLLYVYSYHGTGSSSYGIFNDVCLVVCGICFGLAATVRSNGLFSGVILFLDACIWLGLFTERFGISILNLRILPLDLQNEVRSFPSRRLPATILAGIFVAIGFTTPQYVAYVEYCGEGVSEIQPWCSKFPPSIYSWVQSRYWNVGFLKYWTLSNVPLFLLAAPMLFLLSRSSWLALTGRCDVSAVEPNTSNTKSKGGRQEISPKSRLERDSIIFRLALPQLALASLALTSFHVQIITRLSSGYSLWYLVLAREVIENHENAKWTVRYMVIYAMIQGVLFAGFLPPA